MRGRKRSSAYFVSPVTFAHASILGSGRPMTENSCFSIEGGFAPSESIDRDRSGVVPIVVLLATRGRLAAHANGGELARVLGPCQAKVLPKDLEERLVDRHEHFVGLTVDGQAQARLHRLRRGVYQGLI